MGEVLKTWIMVVVTFTFALLYAAALFGWIKPLNDVTMITHLEPIIFVAIGYYFGRLPAQQNEKTLKDEINRLAQKADAAQHAKEQIQQTRESLEERIKNVNAALTTARNLAGAATENTNNRDDYARDDALRSSVTAALRILKS